MIAKLDALRLNVPIGFFSVYHDEGYVDSVHEYLRELANHNNPFPNGRILSDRMHPNSAGCYIRFFDGFMFHHHIFYKDFKDDTINLGNRAHEEVEFLIDQKKGLHHLINAIAKDFRITIDYKKILDRQAVAYLGSVYALLLGGFSLPLYQNGIQDEKYEKAFETAKSFFE